MNSAPMSITLMVCPECGRNDRYQPFTGRKHYHYGRPCKGQPVRYLYELAARESETSE